MVSPTDARDTLTTMRLLQNTSPHNTKPRAARSAHGWVFAADELPVTAATREALKRDLESLRAQQREIPARLRVAREFGDTANNDEHLAIREEEAVMVARIARLEATLLRAAVVQRNGAEGSVAIGSKVSVVDIDTGEELEYVIGSAHGVLSRGTVSPLSPVGRALLGRRVGERASVQLPHARRKQLELREILHPCE
jgi:transcription elongation factor GreA